MASKLEKRRTGRRRDLRIVVVVVIALAVFAGLIAVDRATVTWGACSKAEDEVDDVLRAMAVLGEDDAGLQRMYLERDAARDAACD